MNPVLFFRQRFNHVSTPQGSSADSASRRRRRRASHRTACTAPLLRQIRAAPRPCHTRQSGSIAHSTLHHNAHTRRTPRSPRRISSPPSRSTTEAAGHSFEHGAPQLPGAFSQTVLSPQNTHSGTSKRHILLHASFSNFAGLHISPLPVPLAPRG